MTSHLPQALFFDFDGVLVDSNPIKIEAFYDLFKGYDSTSVEELIEYHRQHGGISRVVKIKYAFDNILKLPLTDEQQEHMARIYSELVVEKVIATASIDGADEFLHEMQGRLPIFVISGTPQDELQLIISRRNMGQYFNEVLGSPIQKPEHIQNLLKKYQLNPARCIFIGDAFTDLHAARTNNMPFIGIQGDFNFPPDVMVLPDCTELKATIISLSNS